MYNTGVQCYYQLVAVAALKAEDAGNKAQNVSLRHQNLNILCKDFIYLSGHKYQYIFRGALHITSV